MTLQPTPALEPLGSPQADSGCLVMGILNATPDSFSDGGRLSRVEDAVGHAVSLACDGADIVDIGGESTRPGATRVCETEELRRVLPIVDAVARVGLPFTIDTMRSAVAVAEAAVAAGATGVNDVSGGLADPRMVPFIAESRVPYVLTHWRAHSAVGHAAYDDIVGTVTLDLANRLRAVERAGVDLDHVTIDPGLGFAKTAEHTRRLLDGLDALKALGQPVLIGASRKRFLRKRIGAVDESPLVEQLDIATAAVSALAAVAGVYCVRVHNAKSTAIAVKIGAGWTSGADRQSIGASVNGHRENSAHTPPGADSGEDRHQAETRIARAPSP